MALKKWGFVCLLCLCSMGSFAQELAFGRKIVDTLTTDYFWGRGYTKNGMTKAADFIASSFQKYGLKPLQGTDFQQPFQYAVNTFPGRMEVSINGQTLIPGQDFIVSPESQGLQANGRLTQLDSVTWQDETSTFRLVLKDKLTWSVRRAVAGYTLVEVCKKALREPPSTYSVNIENRFIEHFDAANVCGMVRGTAVPDSFLVISAHYDHLGGMGNNTYFAGANDNASGVALLMNLARYYAKHPPRYSMAFIAFAGEEAGLVGSKYFTEHPLIPLSHIRFLLNTDLAGTGEEGITVVNANEFPGEFAMLNAINANHTLLTRINPRGKAANSDHYFFSEKGVPAFFIYTLGGIKAYHDVYDRAETLPLTEHEDLFKLIVLFNNKLMGK